MDDAVVEFEKGKNIKLTDNFYSKEFNCKCSYKNCKKTLINMAHVEILQAMRRVFGPLKITSGYRCVKHNKDVGGTMKSQHVKGSATDIVIKNTKMPQEVFAMLSDNLFDGVGRYDTFTHVDSRGYAASWDHRS